MMLRAAASHGKWYPAGVGLQTTNAHPPEVTVEGVIVNKIGRNGWNRFLAINWQVSKER